MSHALGLICFDLLCFGLIGCAGSQPRVPVRPRLAAARHRHARRGERVCVARRPLPRAQPRAGATRRARDVRRAVERVLFAFAPSFVTLCVDAREHADCSVCSIVSSFVALLLWNRPRVVFDGLRAATSACLCSSRCPPPSASLCCLWWGRSTCGAGVWTGTRTSSRRNNKYKYKYKILPALSWGQYRLVTQKGLRTLALVSGIVTLFLFHRPITRSAFTLFLCTRIYDSWWLAGDLDTACYDGAHSRWMWGIGVPTLLVYSLGVPLAVALLIRAAASGSSTTDTGPGSTTGSRSSCEAAHRRSGARRMLCACGQTRRGVRAGCARSP